MTPKNQVEQVQIYVEPRRWDRTAHGIVCLLLGDEAVAFPSRRWDDFLAAVLTWGMRAVREVVVARSLGATWSFMDGPYRVRIERVDGESVRLRLIDEASQVSAIGTYVVGQRELVRQLLLGAEKLEAEYHRHGWPADPYFSGMLEDAAALRRVIIS